MRLRSRRKQSHWDARNASAGGLSLICARRSKPYRQLPLDGSFSHALSDIEDIAKTLSDGLKNTYWGKVIPRSQSFLRWEPLAVPLTSLHVS